MAATVVIPARFGSTRFPAKILAAETGLPLVQHVVERVRKCRLVKDVLVATDDRRIADALRRFETAVVMTSPDHQSGTDRVWEVVRKRPAGLFVNVQGDEPEIEPELVDALIEQAEQGGHEFATCAAPFPAGAYASDPNLVKVVVGLTGRALYFSRSPVPFRRDPDAPVDPPYLLHLGIYAYTSQFLSEFTAWRPSPLEQAEKLEQLRALDHGRSCYVLRVARATHGIDTPEQYAAFVKRWSAASGQLSAAGQRDAG